MDQAAGTPGGVTAQEGIFADLYAYLQDDKYARQVTEYRRQMDAANLSWAQHMLEVFQRLGWVHGRGGRLLRTKRLRKKAGYPTSARTLSPQASQADTSSRS